MHIVIYSQFKLKFCYDLVNWHFSFIVKLNIVFPTAAGHQHAGYVWEVQHPVLDHREPPPRGLDWVGGLHSVREPAQQRLHDHPVRPNFKRLFQI